MAVGLAENLAIKRPLRIDARVAIGIMLVLLTVASGFAVWRTVTSTTRPLLMATRDLPAGTVLTPADLTSTDVRVDDDVYQAAVPGEALNSAIGKQLSEPVHAHQLLARASLSGRPVLGAGESAMTIPIAPTNAAGGLIRPGDDVKIVATTDRGHPDSKTTIILPRVRVYDVGYAESTSITAGSGSNARGAAASLTLIVNDDQAVILGQARWNSDLDALLLPPASQS